MNTTHLSPYSNLYWVFWLGDIIPSPACSLAKPHRINSSITLCLLNTDDFASHGTGYKDMNECKLLTISSELPFKQLWRTEISRCNCTWIIWAWPVERGWQKARVLYPFCLDLQVLLQLYTPFFLRSRKRPRWVGRYSVVSITLSIFCSAGLQDHRYITMRSFGSIASSCHTEPRFPHSLFNTPFNSTGSAHYNVLSHCERQLLLQSLHLSSF